MTKRFKKLDNYVEIPFFSPRVVFESTIASYLSLKLTKLAKLSVRSKLTTIVTDIETSLKIIAKSIVAHFVNFAHFERSDNFRKLSN